MEGTPIQELNKTKKSINQVVHVQDEILLRPPI